MKYHECAQDERLHFLLNRGVLTREDVDFFTSHTKIDPLYAEQSIECSVGYFEIPLAIVPEVLINGVSYAIPLATEETSVVAALFSGSNFVKRHQGTIETQSDPKIAIGQLQFAAVRNFDDLFRTIEENREKILALANRGAAARMVVRGGGVRDFKLRRLEGEMAVLHLFIDTKDAMGANTINQILEGLRVEIEKISGEKIALAILSNLNDCYMTSAKIRLPHLSLKMAQAIEQSSRFAMSDPYRAVTHNKGIMNGIDALLLATGNDWRAVEAAMHGYAGKEGGYRPLSQWRVEGKELIGELRAPIVTGIVGGVTKIHPTARRCLALMKVQSATELSEVAAAVGLLQNFAALRALTSEGITRGHMSLHIKNLLLAAGATREESRALCPKLQAVVRERGYISESDAHAAIKAFRQN